MSGPSVIVVGAGVVGLGVALELARRGTGPVTVVDRDHPGSGSSGLSAGIFNRQYSEPHEVEVRVVAARIFDQLEREGRLHVVRNGFVRLGRDHTAVESFHRSVELQGELDGGSRARVLTPEELGRLIPELNRSGVIGALQGPDDGYLDGHELCTTYYDEAVSLGVEVRPRTELLEAHVRGSGTHVVKTSAGSLEADVVVNAAGAWAGRVGELLHAPVQLRPQRHEAFVFEYGHDLSYVMPSVMDYVVGASEPGLYFRAEGHNQLLAGLHANDAVGAGTDDPDDFFRGVVSEHVDEVASRLLGSLPSLEDMGFHSGWAGLYPLSIDNQPIVGPAPDAEGIVMACGLGGVGVNLGPVAARIVAEWILDGRPSSIETATRWSPQRFAERAAVAPGGERRGA